MLRFRRDEIRYGPIDWAGRSITLVAEQWTAGTATPWFAGGATYCRPVRVEDGGSEDDHLPIRDHVMIARCFAFLVTIATLAERRLFK